MNKSKESTLTTIGLTVFFEEPFWVGVLEGVWEGKLSVCKITFGAEPKDYELYDFVLKNYYHLRFSPAMETNVKEASRNPKRIQREVRKQVQNTGIGTKSQQALKLQQEQLKTERKQMSREQKEAEKQRQFELKQQKKKEKHKGR
ncbi:MAG: YjdF family protein [Lachnospiraceae bacterium]|nr:YjdF family protein [Lachnospiraceae bacterium]